MVDEADVVLIFPENSSVIVERISRDCPPPSHQPKRACLIFLRCGQFLKEGRDFVSETLLQTMTKRKQKFVLVTAWQEIWCTPYAYDPPNIPRKRESLSPLTYKSIMRLLESPLLLRWYGKNICMNHPKLKALPLGAKKDPNGIDTFERMFKTHLWYYLGGHRPKELFQNFRKSKLLANPHFEVTNTDLPAHNGYRHLRRELMKYLEKQFGKKYVAEVKNITIRGVWPTVKKYDALTYFEGILFLFFFFNSFD